ncbi:MOXD1 homolog 1 [Anoplophora glabripennis]|uniref:MOXD1 homolog 1 n=1 Tax=Anoplophora glabripennis TaxID=217634 RepID=UPI000873D3C2|nr:MOXD1 homolog 1 [Anoplophora glabripennis]
MARNWTIYVLSVAILLKTSASVTEDLLDQYVRHVGNVNRLGYDLDSDFKSNQRHGRDYVNKFKRSRYSRLTRKLRSVEDEEEEIASGISVDEEESGDYRERRDVSSDILWTHSEVLDRDGLVVLRWQPRHQEILFRVEARTRGYVGIGFSPDGGMEKADIVLGWVEDDSGKAVLMDCHGVPKSQGSAPVRDEVDNYTLMRGLQNDSHTVIEFRRVLDTCDPDDYVLSADTVRVIWALHDSDPQHGAEMVYHGEKRGSQSIHLLGPPPVPKVAPGHSRNWDITLKNFKVQNNMNTMYWCKVFKAPTLNDKHHIIGFEPIIGPKHSTMVHHMIVHECELDKTANPLIWDNFAKDDGRLCYSDMPTEWEKCLTPLVTWAVGSKGESFPNHVGLPLAGKKNSYYMLEVHFDNPMMVDAVDTSGVRVHYTSELRENEGGVLITGVALSTLHFVPPYQKEYKTAGYCSVGCTKEVFPKDGINVVSVMLHSHLAGRKLKLRHIRAGKELAPLAQDDRYDFNYQQSRSLSQDTPILPGDGLITECTYSTVNRSRPTLGGYSTREEMCLAFVLHYPRTQLAGCYSIPPVKYFFETLGIREFYGKDMIEIEQALLEGKTESETETTTTPKPFENRPGDEMSPEANMRAIIALRNAKEYSIVGENGQTQNMFDKLVIKEPLEFRNLSFSDHLQNIPYNETIFTKKMEEYFYKGLHLTFCRKRDDSLAIKENIERLPNFEEYKNKGSIQCSSRTKMPFFSSSVAVKLTSKLILAITLFLFYTC